MSFSRVADNKIREAMERGEFDNLPGAGRRVDLDEYFATAEDLRMAHSILKSAGCLPEEVELLNEIAALERELAGATPSASREATARCLRDRRVQLAIRLEQRRRSSDRALMCRV